ncbi:MAG: zf-HC2 domain-containing protein [Acidimicrobiia bacterium]|nr:zf-HC2 domain-containing protein [Acidimicrobiia bacterium]
MECTRSREIISARLDGEDVPGEHEAILSHLAVCPECRAFEADAGSLHRAARLMPAEPVPDLTLSIMAAVNDEAHRDDSARLLRPMLVAVAVVQIAVSVPGLLLGEDSGLPVHTARHLGSFAVALAVGFLYAALRPARTLAIVSGLLPVTTALVACLVGTALLDVAAGRTTAIGEVHHATEIAGLAILWLMSRGERSAKPRFAV